MRADALTSPLHALAGNHDSGSRINSPARRMSQTLDTPEQERRKLSVPNPGHLTPQGASRDATQRILRLKLTTDFEGKCSALRPSASSRQCITVVEALLQPSMHLHPCAGPS